MQDERRAAEIAREEEERAKKRELEEDKLKMKAAIEQEARLAERREAVRLARQQEAQVTRIANNSELKLKMRKLSQFDDVPIFRSSLIICRIHAIARHGTSFDSYRERRYRFWHGVPICSPFPFDLSISGYMNI